jgi:hypothetical protein
MSVSKFAGLNASVQKWLVTEEAYKNEEYEALKKDFLGTDEDFLAGQFIFFIILGRRSTQHFLSTTNTFL